MITVKQWKDLVSFEPISKEGVIDVDGTIRQIAIVRGKTVEEIEESLTVDELLPEYINCVHDVNALVFSKLDVMPKNGNGDKQ